MNICFLKGKVIAEVEFKFYISSKNISVATTQMELGNRSSITIKGYNEMADWMYQNIEKEDYVYIQGKINGKMEVEVFWIKR